MTYTPTAAEVKALRDATSAGMLDCRNALIETSGDIEAAIKLLREKGIARAAKLSEREASEGIVHSYIHGGGRVGVLVEVNCLTDFVANTEPFKEFAREVAMQIAANPQTRYISREQVPGSDVEAELEIFRVQAADKPENVRDRIAQGKLDKWYQEIVLLEQPYIRDGAQTIEKLRTELASATGENIQVRRFARFERGGA